MSQPDVRSSPKPGKSVMRDAYWETEAIGEGTRQPGSLMITLVK